MFKEMSFTLMSPKNTEKNCYTVYFDKTAVRTISKQFCILKIHNPLTGCCNCIATDTQRVEAVQRRAVRNPTRDNNYGRTFPALSMS